MVSDPAGYGVPGVVVTFTASGGGSFGGSGVTATATTDSQGFATSPVFSVSAAGVYLVTASVAGLPKTATFSLDLLSTNLAVAPSELAFNYNLGSTNPPSQTINVTEDIPFTTSVRVTPVASWLTATLGTVTSLSASASVSINPAGMSPALTSDRLFLALTRTTLQSA